MHLSPSARELSWPANAMPSYHELKREGAALPRRRLTGPTLLQVCICYLSSFCPPAVSSSAVMSEDADSPPGNKPPTAGDSIDFRFLNFSHPKDAKNATTRRNVRSHVTGVQHARQRQAAAEQAKRSQSSSSSRVPPSPNLAGPSSSYQGSYAGSPALSETETSSPDEASPISPAATSGSPPNSPLPRLNPLEVYPEEWHPYLRPLIVSRPSDRSNASKDDCANTSLRTTTSTTCPSTSPRQTELRESYFERHSWT